MMKQILISGTSRGIGYALVETFLSRGHRVLSLSRSNEHVSSFIDRYPEQFHYLCINLSESDTSISSYLEDLNIKVDVLINNAGLLINKPFLALTDEDWNQEFQANVMTSVRLIRSALPYMNKPSSIVNISSMGGYQGSSKYLGLSSYSSMKGALSILTECLATELAGYSIHVNALCLGAVKTEMLSQAFPGYEAPVDAPTMASYIARFALEDSALYNGQILPVAMSNPS